MTSAEFLIHWLQIIKSTEKMQGICTFFSSGFRSPNEEAYYNNMADLSKIKPVLTNQLEVGYKYYSRTFDIAVIPFYSTLKNLSFTDVYSNGTSEKQICQYL